MSRKRPTNLSRQRRKKRDKPIFSIAFLIAIPANFALSIVCLITLVTILSVTTVNTETWAVFATGVVGALAVIGGSSIQKLRVLIHETKHAIVVLLSGNNLKNFVVGDKTGHVEYEMYKDTVHFAPIIALAPYFFPLFSLPMLILCIAFEGDNNHFLALGLGLTFATDLSTAYTDLHPHQTDLQKISGGAIAALLYLAGVHFLWTMVCLLWVAGGRTAYAHLFYTIASFAGTFASQIS